jgi:uncharacterized phiE125 gp8 family phage protein
VYKIVTEPSELAVDLLTVKAFCKITHDAEDAFIPVLIKSATKIIEDESWLQIISAPWFLQVFEWPATWLEIGKGNVTSVTSVKYFDENDTEQTLPSDKYITDLTSWPARIFFKEQPSLSYKLPYVRVYFTAGFGTTATNVPDDLKSALMLTTRMLYDKRTGEDTLDIPPAAKHIARRYRNKIVKR